MTEKEVSERGFIGYDKIMTDYGHELRVQESSAANGPHLWLFIGPSDQMESRDAVHLNAHHVRRLRDALTSFLEEIPQRWEGGEKYLDPSWDFDGWKRDVLEMFQEDTPDE